MPIPEKVWEDGEDADSWVMALSKYLDRIYPRATSPAELANEFFGEYEDEVVATVYTTFLLSCLEILVNDGSVEMRLVDASEYEGGSETEMVFRKIRRSSNNTMDEPSRDQ